MSASGSGRRRLSKRDLRLLSAYLDGELEPRRRALLESRLEREPELRLELEELRRTVEAVRSLPKVAAPRSFALTPDMVGARRMMSGLWFLRVGTVGVIASVMLLTAGLLMGLAGWAPPAPRLQANVPMGTVWPTAVEMVPQVTPTLAAMPLSQGTPVPPVAGGAGEADMAVEELPPPVPSAVEREMANTVTPMPLGAPAAAPMPTVGPIRGAPTATEVSVAVSVTPSPDRMAEPACRVTVLAPWLIGLGGMGLVISLILLLSGRRM